MFVILNPLLTVTLSPLPVTPSEAKNLIAWLRTGFAKGLGFPLRVNCVKNLIESMT